jgi:hypothetical protein
MYACVTSTFIRWPAVEIVVLRSSLLDFSVPLPVCLSNGLFRWDFPPAICVPLFLMRAICPVSFICTFQSFGEYSLCRCVQSLPGVHWPSCAMFTVGYFHEIKTVGAWSWPLIYGENFTCSKSCLVVFFILLYVYHTDFTLVVKTQNSATSCTYCTSRKQPVCVFVVCVEKEEGIGYCQRARAGLPSACFLDCYFCSSAVLFNVHGCVFHFGLGRRMGRCTKVIS